MISLKILGGDFRYSVDERACARKDVGERCGVGSFCITRRHQDDEQVQHKWPLSIFRRPHCFAFQGGAPPDLLLDGFFLTAMMMPQWPQRDLAINHIVSAIWFGPLKPPRQK